MDAMTYDSLGNVLHTHVEKRVTPDGPFVPAYAGVQAAVAGDADVSAYLPHHNGSWSSKRPFHPEKKGGSSSQKRARRNRRLTVDLEITLPECHTQTMDGGFEAVANNVSSVSSKQAPCLHDCVGTACEDDNVDGHNSMDIVGAANVANRNANISSASFPLLQPLESCKHCHALLWLQEKVKGKGKDDVSFAICCQHGKVSLPFFKQSPPKLDILLDMSTSSLQSKRYCEHIRSFNSMFAMTSHGAKVDYSVLKG